MFFKTRTRWVELFESHLEFENRIVVGKIIRISIEDKWYAASNNSGDLLVFEENCPHQKGSLLGGKCEHGQITCPWHHYKFSVKDGKDLSSGGNPIKMLATKFTKGKWMVGIEIKVPFWMD